jgi:imidazolonepropionase-like amidohydrolase
MTRSTQRSTQPKSLGPVGAAIGVLSFLLLLVAADTVAFAAAKATKLDLAARVLPPPAEPGRIVAPYIRYPRGKIALVHVRVIDGSGAPPAEDQTLLIDGERIAAVGPAASAMTDGYRLIEANGLSVFPGLVGMHEHQFYAASSIRPSGIRGEPPLHAPQMTFSAPRMYLAGGITTLRTTGSLEPYTDINLKQQIDSGAFPGPHMDVTGPYLEGPGSYFVQMHPLRDVADAARTVNFWADQGASSFKAYMNISRAELKAAIDAAHARGIKVTGHLCSVTYPEAANLGIDNLEHGFFVNTQLDAGKMPDACSGGQGDETLMAMTPETDAGHALIRLLVDKHVAVTSTLAVFEEFLQNARPIPARALDTLTVEARTDYLLARDHAAHRPPEVAARLAKLWANDLAMEHAFAAAGGLLLAGSDPTGAGDVLPGFGNQRGIELLVDAGFTPLEALRIATLNGATYLGLADRIGTVKAGKNADLVLVRGNPSQQISDIENVVTVFKDGIGYDPDKLLQSVRGRFGQY